MELKRVVVTGLGSVTPLGNNTKDYWAALLAGQSGAGPITLFDSTNFKTKFACEVKNFDPLDHFDKKESKKMDRNTWFGIAAAREAILNSGLLSPENNPDKFRIGVIWGSGIGGIETFEKEILEWAKTDIPRFNPFFIPKMIADITPGHISIEYGLHGPNYTTVSACASSANALIDAKMLIQLGKADAIVCGGSEAAITSSGVGGFNALMALSTRNESPQTASRPFDKDRDGFVLGEGAGSIILESLDHALARGATIYAELLGGGLSADAYHMTAPHPEGLGAYMVMKSCLDDAGISADQVDHINMHGTSTPLGDIAESSAISKLFGNHAYDIQINSTKSMTGHLLGAAGVIEAISTVLAIQNDIVPPTINHFTDDPEIDSRLNFTFNTPVKKIIQYAMSNTFGFGGHNACVLFGKYNPS